MTQKSDIVFHMGAHKTASTHLQHVIKKNQASILRHGVLALGPPDLRGKNRKTINKALDGVYNPPKTEVPKRLLIADENLLGKAWNTEPRGKGFLFYPDTLERLRYFRHKFDGRPVRLALALRNPCDFVTSCYMQSILGGGKRTWAEFIAGCDMSGISWARVVHELNVDWIQEITVWRYEDYRYILQPILDALLGSQRPQIQPDMNRLSNVSVSATGLQEIRQLRLRDAPEESVRVVRKEKIATAADPKLNPFTLEECEQSWTSYDADVALVNTLPKVHFITPQP